jgi:hypothetical protein
MKQYRVSHNIGSARYVVSFHDGEKTHSDKSPFFDIQIFKRKVDMTAFIRVLVSKGYIA